MKLTQQKSSKGFNFTFKLQQYIQINAQHKNPPRIKMQVNFEGKTALVTGAGRGIGRAIVEKLDELGAKVIAVSRSQNNLDELIKVCPKIVTVQCDLGNWDETQTKLREYTSNVDLLVNNAAVSELIDVGDIQENQIDSMIDVNFKSCLNLIQMCLPGMRERRFGSIVNISSLASYGAFDGHCIYGTTKVALDYLTKSTASEHGKFNIRCNSVNPTVVWTEMGKQFWSEETKQKALKSKIPMDRFVEVEEVVAPVMFLLSNYAAMINGTTLPIDGGISARG